MPTGLPLATVYELWLRSWETALAALVTATRNRTLSATEAGAHRTVIAAEREFVTRQFALLNRMTTNDARA